MNEPSNGAIDPITHHRLISTLITSNTARRRGTVERKHLSACQQLHQPLTGT